MTWFFGYGSLMWNPGFAYVQREAALLRGYHRWFGSISVTNRGTEESPGMMMNLIAGGSCVGAAYRVSAEGLREARAYLDKREGEGKSNKRVMLPVKLQGSAGQTLVNAWAYLPMASNKNFVGVLPMEKMLPLLNGAAGKIGTSYDYLCSTLEELANMNAREPALEELLRTLDDYRGNAAASSISGAG